MSSQFYTAIFYERAIMKKLVPAVIAAVLTTVGCSTMRGHDMQSGNGMMMHMKSFDSNGDGMLTREEFMKAHEVMFDQMKGSNGMINLKQMPMHGKGMMGTDHPMPGQKETGTK
jgi:hypothetical protein